MKEDYFDPIPEPESAVLPETESQPSLLTEEKPKKRQLMGHDLSTLLVAGAAMLMLAVFAVWPDNPPARTFIPEEEPPQETAPPLMLDGASETEALREFSGANREAITLLNERTGAVEQQLARLGKQLNRLAANPVKQPQEAPQTGTSRPAVPTLPGWRIRTLHPGVAWLTFDGSTWVTHVGDVVNGVTIQRIDLEQRVVVTDKGVIRQGS